MQSQNISFKLRLDSFLASSYSVVRLSILASQAKDSGSNPDGSISFVTEIYADHIDRYGFNLVKIQDHIFPDLTNFYFA